jgi:hypothetical protein
MQTYGETTGAGGGKQSIEEFFANLEATLSLPKLSDFQSAIVELDNSSRQIIKTFTQGRERMLELTQAAADAVPQVLRLGGSLQDVTNNIIAVANASKRNVVASTKEIETLYAAYKTLGLEAENLTNAFLNVGMAAKDIRGGLEGSVEYVQSIGGNASQVVKLMVDNMDQLNRYQFDGGVKGLTKMAAQASMLRFDMNQTFQLAEKVLNPESAIEVASAFQRLGVSIGNLVDPFQLMNQSINDPGGIQNSLAEMTKQFSYFDEKTKTFKINPQGVLTLNEIAQQTGISASELRKMSVAAADLDRRLSAVSSAGLQIASEEDKQYLANIARITEQGTYEVTVKDEKSGKLITKDLTDVTQTEFDKLIKEQKEGPKTLEELARSQMTITESINADVSAIKNKIVGGVASAEPVQNAIEGFRSFINKLGGNVSNIGSTAAVRGRVEQAFEGAKSLKDEFISSKDKGAVIRKYLDSLGGEFKEIKGELSTAFNKALKDTQSQLSEDRPGEAPYKKYMDKLLGTIPGSEKTTTAAAAAQSGMNTKQKELADQAIKNTTATGTQTTTTIKIEGGVTVKLDLPSNFNQLATDQQMKILDSVFNSQKFQQLIISNASPQSATKAPVSKSFTP